MFQAWKRIFTVYKQGEKTMFTRIAGRSRLGKQFICAKCKNPRRAKCLTGIYAKNQKLKYGVDECSSCINFLTEIVPGTALAVFAFRGLTNRSNKNIAPVFSSRRRQSSLPTPPLLQTSFKIKNPPLSGFPILNGRGGGIRTHDLTVPNRARYHLRYAP